MSSRTSIPWLAGLPRGRTPRRDELRGQVGRAAVFQRSGQKRLTAVAAVPGGGVHRERAGGVAAAEKVAQDGRHDLVIEKESDASHGGVASGQASGSTSKMRLRSSAQRCRIARCAGQSGGAQQRGAGSSAAGVRVSERMPSLRHRARWRTE